MIYLDVEKKIERLREQLYNSIDRNGLNAKETQRINKEIEKLMNEYYKKQEKYVKDNEKK